MFRTQIYKTSMTQYANMLMTYCNLFWSSSYGNKYVIQHTRACHVLPWRYMLTMPPQLVSLKLCVAAQADPETTLDTAAQERPYEHPQKQATFKRNLYIVINLDEMGGGTWHPRKSSGRTKFQGKIPLSRPRRKPKYIKIDHKEHNDGVNFIGLSEDKSQ
jgi:hypothetical protein